MPEVVKFEKSSEPAVQPKGFIQTETAKDILRSLDLVRSINGRAVTMISGAPGIGKTETLFHYMEQVGQDAIYISIAKGEGNPSHVATAILRCFGHYVRRENDLTKLRYQIGDYIGAQRILLVDEATNLFQRNKASCTKGSAFGWLVAASEEQGFDPAFCGDLQLPQVMAEFPHLQSRMRRPVIIRSVSASDVQAFAASAGLGTPQEIALLSAVASLPGGLRHVRNVLEQADIFAKGAKVTGLHLRAAISDLKLQPQGGK